MTQIPLRLPDNVLAQARHAADEDNVSVEHLLGTFIAEGLEHRSGLRSLRERAARADLKGALAILDKVPDVPPDAGDEIPKRRPSRRGGRQA